MKPGKRLTVHQYAVDMFPGLVGGLSTLVVYSDLCDACSIVGAGGILGVFRRNWGTAALTHGYSLRLDVEKRVNNETR